MMKVICIIQARMNSTRLQGKILKRLEGKTVLEHVINRVRKAKEIDEVIIATTINKSDDIIEKFCKEKNIQIYRGSEENVLSRYYYASEKFNGDIIIRITSDCPCVDYKLLNKMIEEFKKNNNIDYFSNTIDRTFPRGYDIEIFKFNCLKKAFNEAKEEYEKEHVTPFMYDMKRSFKIKQYKDINDNSDIRLTLDTKEDFLLLENIYKALYQKDEFFTLNTVLEYLNKNIELCNLNKQIIQKGW